MNVRLRPVAFPSRTDTYSGVVRVRVTWLVIQLHFQADVKELPSAEYLDIEIDEGGAVS